MVVNFLSRERKPNQKKTPVSRLTLRVAQPVDEATHRAAMRRCQACSGAHNLTIAARLASLGALPDSMMLAASTGCCGRSARKLAACALASADSDSPCAYFRPPRRCSARDKGINTKT
jgi:hypothetical protein